MRNLQLLKSAVLQHSVLHRCRAWFICSSEYGISKTTRIFSIGEDFKIYDANYKYEENSISSTVVGDLHSIKELGISESIHIVDFRYFSGTVTIILSNGWLVVTDIHNQQLRSYDLKLPDIVRACWNFECERFVTISSTGILKIFRVSNEEYDQVAELLLQRVSDERNKFINVGWGKVETQFQGSRGKLTAADKVHAPSVKPDPDGIRVTWKENNTAFAVNYTCDQEHVQKLKIFDRNGNLLNVSKDLNGLGIALHWRPSTIFITCVQKTENKQLLSFVEQNGLRYGTFPLAECVNVYNVRWNTTGKILLCCGKDVVKNTDRMMVCTFSNAKLFVKQHLEFKSAVRYFQWDEEYPNRLHVVLENGTYKLLEWSFQVTESSGSSVTVIDGKTLGFTDFRSAFHPPTMFANQVTYKRFVNRVLFRSGIVDRDSMLVFLDNDKVLFTRNEQNAQKDVFSFKYEPSGRSIAFSTPAEISPLLWQAPNTLFCGWNRTNGYYFCVCTLDLSSKCCVFQKILKLPSPITTICDYNQEVLIYLENGRILVYRDGNLNSTNFLLNEPCYRVKVLNASTTVALSESGNLYVNDQLKRRDIHQFYWKAPFLVTVTGDQLVSYKVTFQGKNIRLQEISSRSIESKSYLLSVVDDKVLLVAERGNLEIIVPRPFAVTKMEKKLSDKRYLEVFKILRKQRITFNMICDHDPVTFAKDVSQFFADLSSDPVSLAMFAADLENENVANRLFPWKYSSTVATNKIDTICGQLCALMEESAECEKYALPLIVMLVKRSRLTEATELAIRKGELGVLFQLMPVQLIYKAALRSYNLNHVIRVAEHANMDPGDYLPFVKSLEKMEENYKRFTIHKYLGEHEHALQYLAECQTPAAFEECVKYISEKKLHRKGMQIFGEKDVLRYKRVLTLFAEHLFEEKRYDEAALLFEKVDLYDKAINCYLQIGNWHSVALVVRHVGYDQTESSAIYQQLYSVLHRDGKHEDAAHVALNLLNDSVLAVKSYLLSQRYGHAVSTAKYGKDGRLLSSVVKPALIEEAETIVRRLMSAHETIQNYQRRLNEIYAAEKRLADGGNDEDSDNDVDDAASCISSSFASSGVNTSKASTRARARKLEKKLWNLKKGNPREKPSLISVIRETVVGCEQFSKAIPDLVKALINVNEYGSAERLNREYAQFTRQMEFTVSAVWPVSGISEEGGFKDIQIRCPPSLSVRERIKLLE